MEEMGKIFWNNEAKWWKNSNGFGGFAEDIRKYTRNELQPYLPKTEEGVIVNLGGGNDTASLTAWDMNKVITLDYARQMLNEDQIANPVEADARCNLPIKGESADLVCSFFLMRYLAIEEQVSLISEGTRILKTGGHLVIIDTPNNGHLCQVEKFYPDRFLILLKSLGMEVLECDICERMVTHHINTGFGGWNEVEKYKVGVLAARKLTVK